MNWSLSMVLGRMLYKPLFPGESGVNQLVEIIKLYDIRAMKELESFRGHRKDVTGMKLPRLKFSMHMIIACGILPDILLDIFYAAAIWVAVESPLNMLF
ncbi:hypothetical protein REPUB_Repub05bG0013600 [Reevesia pubescens]